MTEGRVTAWFSVTFRRTDVFDREIVGEWREESESGSGEITPDQWKPEKYIWTRTPALAQRYTTDKFSGLESQLCLLGCFMQSCMHKEQLKSDSGKWGTWSTLPGIQ